MKNRDITKLVIYTLITLGIYGIIWFFSTKDELNTLGANIPSAWLFLIPGVNIYWLWLYSKGIAQVSNHQISRDTSFVLLWLTGVIGIAFLQSEINRLWAAPGSSSNGAQPQNYASQQYLAQNPQNPDQQPANPSVPSQPQDPSLTPDQQPPATNDQPESTPPTNPPTD